MTIRIFSLPPAVADARAAKRIDMLQRVGCQCECQSFERNLSTGRLPDCPVESLGVMAHGRYLRRIFKMLWALPRVRAAIKRNELIYAFNADNALLALVAGIGWGKPIVVEVADIRQIQVSDGLLGMAFRRIDKFLTGACRLLVLTSEGYSTYYRDWLETATPHIVVENKLDAPFAASVQANPPPARPPLAGRPLRIGWFGLLRDAWSLSVLDSLTRARPDDFSVLLAGDAHQPLDEKDFQRRVAANPKLEFRGPYRHLIDLPELYGDIDVVMAGKPPIIPDAWSLTHRLYDACLFAKPLIVRAGSGDALSVRRHDIGVVVQSKDAKAAAEEIATVETAQWQRWQANAAALPPEVHTITNEAEELRDALAGLLA